MLEAIAGDVMGSNYEYDPIKTKYFELLGADCFFTDDTVMTIAVAVSPMNGRGYVETLQMWAREYPGAGSTNGFMKIFRNPTIVSETDPQCAPPAWAGFLMMKRLCSKKQKEVRK